jgi:phosphatidate cytidylyltransferase
MMFVLCALVAVLVAMLVSPLLGLVVALAAGLGMLVPGKGNGWLAGGVAYLVLPCAALLWLRHDAADGRALAFWLIAVVWATDIGAYFAGRLIGGPKLAPAISPNKTWAGLLGGAVAAALVGAVTTTLTAADSLPAMVTVSVMLGVCAQLGDLAESSLKRRFGAKDTSALIPGHGGVLDRVDGLMTAALLLALIDIFREGSMFRWL